MTVVVESNDKFESLLKEKKLNESAEFILSLLPELPEGASDDLKDAADSLAYLALTIRDNKKEILSDIASFEKKTEHENKLKSVYLSVSDALNAYFEKTELMLELIEPFRGIRRQRYPLSFDNLLDPSFVSGKDAFFYRNNLLNEWDGVVDNYERTSKINSFEKISEILFFSKLSIVCFLGWHKHSSRGFIALNGVRVKKGMYGQYVRAIYELQGFEEKFSKLMNDVDICLRAAEWRSAVNSFDLLEEIESQALNCIRELQAHIGT